MSTQFPDTILGQIQYFEQRIPAWAADPAAIGLTALQIGELQTRVTAARAAYDAAQAIRQQSKNTTNIQREAVAEMNTQGTAMLSLIRAFADLSGNPASIFDAADIDAPSATSTPMPPPVPATDLSTSLENSGAVRLKWKGTVANGTVYSVWRRLGENSPFVQIGTSTTKSFVDETIPAGTPEASYLLITLRDGQSSGESEPTIIRFGIMNPPASSGGSASLGLAA
ncbi:MAG TPA: hypothetical protein ENJ00_10715 [Phycisphaerales bacterium]|nr:hypothetical protein [Phycisphaerales bacterium]